MTALQWLRFIPNLALGLLAESVRWLAERPVRLLIVSLILLSAWLWGACQSARDLAEDRRVQAAAWHGKFVAQKAEMLKLGATIRDAHVRAARLDRENIARVQAEWAVHLQEVKHGYEADLAAARAAVAGRMQRGAGSGGNGGAGDGGDADLSGLPVLSTGALRPGAAAIVDAADIDATTVNTVRLEHLIAAWRRAAGIEVNRQP